MLLRLRMSPYAYAYRTCKHPCAYACVVRVNQALIFKLFPQLNHVSTHPTFVRDNSWLKLVGRARVNDDPISRLNFNGLGDIIKLFVVPSDRVFTVIGNVLDGAVAQQSQK